MSDTYNPWRIAKKGKDDLSCIVNGHTICESSCQRKGCNPNEKAHCETCNTSLLETRDQKCTLEVAKIYRGDKVSHADPITGQ